MRLCVVVLAVFLASCTYMQAKDFQAWNDDALQRAVSGESKWSDYYRERYERLSKFPPGTQGAGFSMLLTNTLLDAALLYEAGNLSPADFESLRRRARAEYSMYLERAQTEQQALFNQWLATQAVIQQSTQARRPVSCSTTTLGNSAQTICQ